MIALPAGTTAHKKDWPIGYAPVAVAMTEDGEQAVLADGTRVTLGEVSLVPPPTYLPAPPGAVVLRLWMRPEGVVLEEIPVIALVVAPCGVTLALPMNDEQLGKDDSEELNLPRYLGRVFRDWWTPGQSESARRMLLMEEVWRLRRNIKPDDAEALALLAEFEDTIAQDEAAYEGMLVHRKTATAPAPEENA